MEPRIYPLYEKVNIYYLFHGYKCNGSLSRGVRWIFRIFDLIQNIIYSEFIFLILKVNNRLTIAFKSSKYKYWSAESRFYFQEPSAEFFYSSF